ncbi:type I restriction endonuclease [Hydrogenophaga sp. IBVHS1]|uniref:type I restriction endonuclease n=1 Tax=unclassified Hydrogenophaga TaxID=2610897 RepID=UPI000A321A6E|nr:type I restriction endonuclease [Hydrogenophaga sp. IBVHS1]
MDFIDQLRVLASRISVTKDMIQTEEATKNSMVMPFIQILGYNPFDPLEVTPELIADIGTKKGEKVDYAILRDGKPIMLFECKKAGGDLSINHAGQLFRYFHVTAARFGVLTNGLVYKFFTDLEHPNKMDEKPFFEFNILDFRDRDVEELKKFAKAAFDLDTILTTANELKYTRAIQNKLSAWIENPPEEVVRLLATDLIGNKKFTVAIREQFTPIARRAFEQLIGERINARLKGAMSPEAVSVINLQPPATPMQNTANPIPLATSATQAQVDTSMEEFEAFHLVKAILRDVVSPKRIFIRDAQSYCAVLLDDNNRKPICRLRFNNNQKLRLGLFSTSKEEEVMNIEAVDDVFLYADQLRATATFHLSQT